LHLGRKGESEGQDLLPKVREDHFSCVLNKCDLGRGIKSDIRGKEGVNGKIFRATFSRKKGGGGMEGERNEATSQTRGTLTRKGGGGENGGAGREVRSLPCLLEGSIFPQEE